MCNICRGLHMGYIIVLRSKSYGPVVREKILKLQPIRNQNYSWWSDFLPNQDKMRNLCIEDLYTSFVLVKNSFGPVVSEKKTFKASINLKQNKIPMVAMFFCQIKTKWGISVDKLKYIIYHYISGLSWSDRMVVGFSTTYAISAYYH
jgi:hypothetical protein